MTIFLVFLALLSALAVAATVRALLVDGYRRIPNGVRRDDESVGR